jgi:Protein of unknown function (DUF4232)
MRVLLSLAVILAVVTAMALSAWNPVAASPVAQAVQAKTASCATSGLRVAITWQPMNVGSLGGGALVGSMQFTRKGTTACTVKGWPHVQLDAKGHRLPVVERKTPARPKPAANVRLQSGVSHGKAKVTLQWRNWCRGRLPGPVSLEVWLSPTDRRAVAQVAKGARRAPSCLHRTASSVVEIGPFRSSG